MHRSVKISVLMGGLMLLSAWCTWAVTPTVRLASLRPQIVLSSAIPTKFGVWEEDVNQVAAVINPTTQAELTKIYAETLSRTYVNKRGDRIMLSIAYGTDQRDNLSVHFPEGCYGGQGFAVGPTVEGQLSTSVGSFISSRMVATLNNRIEPITYWIIVGDKVVANSWALKKAKMSYAIKGQIPDATLMRVSSITADSDAAYAMQQEFVNEMLVAMAAPLRAHFSGTVQ